jgi:hypothetical protein
MAKEKLSVSLLSYIQISLETANKFYSWGWRLSLIGAAVTLIGVCLLMWGTRVRDHDFEAKVASATVSAATANERAAALTKEAADVQVVLERERIERLKLEAAIAPRRLTQQQRDAFVAALANDKRSLVVTVTKLGDQEAALYADALISALTTAGVGGINVNNVGVMAPPRYGVSLTVNINDPKGGAIRAALNAAGIPFTLSVAALQSRNADILVGLKPLPQPN